MRFVEEAPATKKEEAAAGPRWAVDRAMWTRAAGYGAASGAWLGVMVGIIFAIVASTGTAGFLAALLWGAALGALFGAPAGLAGCLAAERIRTPVKHPVERPAPQAPDRAGVTSDQRLIAGRYDLYTPPEASDEVRSALLRRRPNGVWLVDGLA